MNKSDMTFKKMDTPISEELVGVLNVTNYTQYIHNSNHSGYDETQGLQFTEQGNTFGASIYINTIGVPIIIGIGILGNLLSLAVFLFTRMRSQTCSIYLAHLNIMDTGFLFCLIPAELGWYGIDILHWNGWCQITVFSSFVFSFLSTWTVVAFTVERFIVVYHPLRKPSMCTKKRALRVLIGLDAGAFIAYSCSLWMTGLTDNYEFPTCTPLPQFKKAFKIISMIDTFITLVIPFISIIIFNSAIIVKIYKFSKQSKMFSATSTDPVTISTNHPNSNLRKFISEAGGSISNTNSDQHNSQTCNSNMNIGSTKSTRLATISKKMEESSTRRRRLYRVKTTRSLLIVSTTFLVLNMPSHIFRLYGFFSMLYEHDPDYSGVVVLIHEIAMFIYYINFACNVFLYVLVSQSFRYGFLSLVKAVRNVFTQKDNGCRSCQGHCRLSVMDCVGKCCYKIQQRAASGVADEGDSMVLKHHVGNYSPATV